jgi:hypothetical protein
VGALPHFYCNSFLHSGCQPLHNSAVNGCLEVCRLLIESQADIQAKANQYAPPYRDDYFYAAKFRFSL